MRLTVRIHRQTSGEGQEGTLRAYVVQGGKEGQNLLARRQITDITTAKQEVERILGKMFPTRLEIEFVER